MIRQPRLPMKPAVALAAALVAAGGLTAALSQPAPAAAGASNTTTSDTRSVIAPRLPSPALGDDAPPSDFLHAARVALMLHHLGEAQEALERAESRALDRSLPPSQARQASKQSLIKQITEARRALSSGDNDLTLRMIGVALRNPEATGKTR